MQIFKQSDTQVYECIHCIGTAVNYTFKKLSKVKFLNHSLYLKKKKVTPSTAMWTENKARQILYTYSFL